jgi:hypothetical protein
MEADPANLPEIESSPTLDLDKSRVRREVHGA